MRLKRIYYWLSPIGLFLFFTVCALPAYGVKIKVSGGNKLNLSEFQVIHQESFDSNTPVESNFWGVLDIGKKPDDPWNGMLSKDAYILTNSAKPSAVRYYFRQQLEKHPGRGLSSFPLTVEVSGTMNDKTSAAGLIYGFDQQTRYYLAFVKGPNNSYAIYNRDEEGFRRIVGGSSKAIKSNKPNTMTIVPEGKEIKFYINGVQLASMEDEDKSAGGAGIIAISSGMFVFDNFTIYERNQSEVSQNTPVKIDQMPTQKKETGESVAAKEKNSAPIPSSPSATKQQDRKLKTPEKPLKSNTKSLKVGMTNQQVLELFGSPDWKRGNRVGYEMKKENKEEDNDNEFIIIEFDENNMVSRFRSTKG